jgi:hypothetical protein
MLAVPYAGNAAPTNKKPAAARRPQEVAVWKIGLIMIVGARDVPPVYQEGDLGGH